MLSHVKKLSLFNIAVSTGSYKQFVETIMTSADSRMSQYTCVANVHMLVEAQNDRDFSSVVTNADIIAPDGMPLSWALRLLYGVRQERVAGMDLLPDLLRQAESTSTPVFFYGGNEELLDKTKAHLDQHYTALNIAGMYSPPFRDLTFTEESDVVQRINTSGAKLVFVILGCPKQEKWMACMKGKINAMMIGVGGALPVMIGMQKRAPKWMQKLSLEWLFRLGQEPRRLFKRYAITNSFFMLLFVKAWLRSLIVKPKPTTIL